MLTFNATFDNATETNLHFIRSQQYTFTIADEQKHSVLISYRPADDMTEKSFHDILADTVCGSCGHLICHSDDVISPPECQLNVTFTKQHFYRYQFYLQYCSNSLHFTDNLATSALRFAHHHFQQCSINSTHFIKMTILQ